MSTLKITDLKVEGTVCPLGIDTTRPTFSYILTSEGKNKYQTAYRIRVATSPEGLDTPDMWDSGKVSSDKTSWIEYEGKELSSRCEYFFRVTVWDEEDNESEQSEVSRFETAFLDPSQFYAKWIAGTKPTSPYLGRGISPEARTPVPPRTVEKSLPVFATEFCLKDDIAKARAYVTGLGMFSLELNGEKVSENLYEPGETDYGKEILYVTYDVTRFLNRGKNAMGAMLGKGFYIEDGDGKYKKLYPNYGELMFKAQIEIEYTDGTTDTVITDEDFRFCEDGPITCSSWTGGEDYDATKELGAYSTVGYDRSAWQKVRIVEPKAKTLKARFYPPITVAEEFEAVEVKQIDDATFLIDFGRNFAGIEEFALTGERGTTIELWPAELLLDGRIDQHSCGMGICDSYTFKGEGVERWSPSFCYHGFRYMELRVKNGRICEPSAEMFKAKLIRCANEKTGYFETSSSDYNIIHTITDRSVQANMFNTATDCPHREKLGWQEESHLLFDTISAGYDIRNWMKKIASDAVTAQHESGLVPDICPEFVRFSGGFVDEPTWGGSCVFIPYYIYLTYGDPSQLKASYPTMIRYMDYLEGKSEGYLLYRGLGDWACYDESTPLPLTVSCTYYMLAKTMAEIADILGKDNKEKYAELARNIKNAVNEAFLDKEIMSYGSGSQASNAMPLCYGIAEGHEEAVLANLVSAVEKSGYHITTGEIALKPMITALSLYGRTDVVLKMLMNRTMPSYLYFVEQNATSLPEYWDMQHSQLHCMMGHMVGWSYHFIAGIENTSVGYKTFKIKPYFPEGMTYLRSGIKTVHGMIQVEWEKKDGVTTLTVNVPVNTTATIELDDEIIVGSGEYTFSI
ncbi:MAG: family 78 glycoside hydrolase catalytic domain [Clostridia bacterium]|nr:family 78 glycoside hydrolase catalytic domain [Clostridia bacterium]